MDGYRDKNAEMRTYLYLSTCLSTCRAQELAALRAQQTELEQKADIMNNLQDQSPEVKSCFSFLCLLGSLWATGRVNFLQVVALLNCWW